MTEELKRGLVIVGAVAVVMGAGLLTGCGASRHTLDSQGLRVTSWAHGDDMVEVRPVPLSENALAISGRIRNQTGKYVFHDWVEFQLDLHGSRGVLASEKFVIRLQYEWDEAEAYDFSIQIRDIEWNHVTQFRVYVTGWGRRVKAPPPPPPSPPPPPPDASWKEADQSLMAVRYVQFRVKNDSITFPVDVRWLGDRVEWDRDEAEYRVFGDVETDTLQGSRARNMYDVRVRFNGWDGRDPADFQNWSLVSMYVRGPGMKEASR